jgi:hypothetical protein
LTEKDIPGSKIGKDIEKATKNNLTFRLKCRDLKFFRNESGAVLYTDEFEKQKRKPSEQFAS